MPETLRRGEDRDEPAADDRLRRLRRSTYGSASALSDSREGFGDGLNGYVDVDDGMARYVLAQAEEGFADARAEKQSIDTHEAFEARRETVRDAFLSSISGLPDRMADPSIETMGRIDRERYAIKSVVFESRPKFHVTTNCYVPDGNGPHPAVLFLCDHIDDPKADPANQRLCIELARNGFVVLIVDPIAQSERLQYRDLEIGETIVAGAAGCSPIAMRARSVSTPRLTVFDVVRTCDREQALATLDRRGVRIESDGTAVNEDV